MALWRLLRLGWRLFRDRRVPLLPKLIVLFAVAYAVLPVDLVPDFFPALGQFDDLTLLLLSLLLLVRLCPPEVVREHLAAMARQPRREARKASGEVIEGEYHIIE